VGKKDSAVYWTMEASDALSDYLLGKCTHQNFTQRIKVAKRGIELSRKIHQPTWMLQKGEGSIKL
jgi:hypothetical protein